MVTKPKHGPAGLDIFTCEICGKDYPYSSHDPIASENAGTLVCYNCADDFI